MRVEATYGGGMTMLDPNSTREFLEAIIAAFSVFGGVIAYFSSYAAYHGLRDRLGPTALSHDINQGLGEGFALGVPSAILALMIMGWS